jgi:hypothetical protein
MQLDLEAWRGRARLCSCVAHRQPKQGPHAKPDTTSKQAADSCAECHSAHRQPKQLPHAKPDIEPNSCSDHRRTHPEPERSAISCADPIAHAEPHITAHDAVSDCAGWHTLPDSRTDDRRTHAAVRSPWPQPPQPAGMAIPAT